MQLLIMAAGMGSRFGGLKQIEPLGPNGEFLIDYSIYDAKENGFSKVVFIIKEENYDIFKSTIGARVEKHIPVEYVFQKIDNVPEFVKIPEDRIKPWGTAHAIYCAKDAITEPFIVINADDFYGKDAYKVAKEFLESKPESYATVGYKVKNTMTENGAVKRGVLSATKGKLDDIIESSIEKKGKKIIASPLNGSDSFEIKADDLVSMNLLAFNPTVFSYIETKMKEFFETNAKNLEKCEFLIPDILKMAKEEKYADVYVLDTNATWYGVTYKEDAANVKASLLELRDKGEYPDNLWR